MYLCSEFRNFSDWRAGRTLIQHNIRRTEFICESGQFNKTERSDAYAMRLHSVHPFDCCQRPSPEPTNTIRVCAFFMPFFFQNLDTLQSFGSKEKYTPLMHFVLMLEIQENTKNN